MKASEIINYIESGNMDSKLRDIYLDESKLYYQKYRYIAAVKEFTALFGQEDKEVEIYSAPGRTEIGGNHTDHQHGQVLAASINDDAIAIVTKSSDNNIKIKSKGYDIIELSIDQKAKVDEEEGTTKALIRGILASVESRGYKLGGFKAFITSDVLGGSGLSSSAAFETIIVNIISGLFNNMEIDPVTIAIIGQYAENVYFGKPCGLLDQMTCSLGSLCHIDFKNPDQPIIDKLSFDLDQVGYSLCITDTKGSHADLTHEYAAIPSEMKEVASYFGKEFLIDVNMDDFMSAIPELRNIFSDRHVLRSLHFFYENQRAKDEANALRDKDFNKFLLLIKASGDSSFKYLQNVYTNTDIKHQNLSIGLCISETILGNDGACRVHGGGFAGTIQAFVKNEKVDEYKNQLDKVYGPGSCAVLKIRKYGGIKVL
ncbi:MAG: galactokinase [Eubacterium sp.]|nr:galactokinase [Eubacterium sp.]